MTPLTGRRWWWAVGGLALLALLLRLPTAGEQGFWLDEVYSARLVEQGLGHAWSTVPLTENTPPLYYLLAWFWTQATGVSELGLRSFSAVVGSIAVIPTALVARRLATPSAGLAAGLLLAVNPFAQWMGQEARTYSLTILLGACAWLALVAALQRPDARRAWLWALAAAALTWTHYFGGFLLGLGGLLLLGDAWRRGRGVAVRPLVAPIAASLVAALALAPIASEQNSLGRSGGIAEGKSLLTRVIEQPKQFPLGYNGPLEELLGAFGAAVMAALVVLALLRRRGDRAAAAAEPATGPAEPAVATAVVEPGLAADPIRLRRVLAATGALVAVIPIALTVVGFDVVLARNVIFLLPLLVALVAAGALRAVSGEVGRIAGRSPRVPVVVATTTLIAVSLITIVAVAVDPQYQRDDWRGALRQSRAAGPQLIAVIPYQDMPPAYYRPASRPFRMPPGGVAVRSLAVVDRPPDANSQAPALVDPTPSPPAPGFRLLRVDRDARFRVYVWQSPTPVVLGQAQIDAMPAGGARTLLLDPTGGLPAAAGR